MTKVVVLPHETVCPQGTVVDIPKGTNICRGLLDKGIDIEHACELSCACTTCHVLIREGFDDLEAADELEEDYLDKAWGLGAHSRLSCQAVVQDKPLVIEIPKYTINMVSEKR